jgi:hypothetical protein
VETILLQHIQLWSLFIQALTANDAIKNLADNQAPEVMKVNYLEHCFNSAKED